MVCSHLGGQNPPLPFFVKGRPKLRGEGWYMARPAASPWCPDVVRCGEAHICSQLPAVLQLWSPPFRIASECGTGTVLRPLAQIVPLQDGNFIFARTHTQTHARTGAQARAHRHTHPHSHRRAHTRAHRHTHPHTYRDTHRHNLMECLHVCPCVFGWAEQHLPSQSEAGPVAWNRYEKQFWGH